MWPIDRTLPSTTSLGQIGPASIDYEKILNIFQISGTGASPSDLVWCHTQGTSYFWEAVLMV